MVGWQIFKCGHCKNPHSPCSCVFRIISHLFGLSYAAALGISKSNDVQLEVSDVRWHTRKFEDSAAHMLALDRLCEAGGFFSVKIGIGI